MFINVNTLAEARIRLSDSRGRSPLRVAFVERTILRFGTIETSEDLSLANYYSC